MKYRIWSTARKKWVAGTQPELTYTEFHNDAAVFDVEQASGLRNEWVDELTLYPVREEGNGEMRTFATGATRDSDSDKLDYEGFISPLVLQRFGEYMHKHRLQSDGSLRDSDNWQKGIPVTAYRKSLIRHTVDCWAAWRDGDAETEIELLCAMMFNVQGLLFELLRERRNGQ